MTDKEYIAHLGELYGEVMSLRKDSDYTINQPQMAKLVDVLRFFLDMTKDLSGEVEQILLEPREEHGGVTATFVVFDIYGDAVKRFCDVMQGASAIGIDSMEDGKICIAVTIPNVFVHK